MSAMQLIININDRKHLSSEDNPADIIIRGITINEMRKFWWQSPYWQSLDDVEISVQCPSGCSRNKKNILVTLIQ